MKKLAVKNRCQRTDNKKKSIELTAGYGNWGIAGSEQGSGDY